MKLPRRRFLHLAAGAAALPAVAHIARAQTYPTRPVRLIVPYAPGSVADTVARLIAQKLSENVGKQFYIENIAGAGGNIAMGRAAHAAPRRLWWSRGWSSAMRRGGCRSPMRGAPRSGRC
jgi:tripartite-type tricarboxylate transporter receptor subunit TctC